MSRKVTLLLLILVIASAIVYAGNVHFVGGVSTSSGSFVAQGDAAGLGSGSYTFVLTANAQVTALCQNNGGHVAPGRSPINVSTASSDTFVSDSNGRTHVFLSAPDPTVLTPPPPSPSPKDAGCPSNNWTVIGFEAGSTYWTGATLQAFDNANGALVLEISWTCAGTAESCVEN